MVKCRNSCGAEVLLEDMHLIGTPDGDAWICSPGGHCLFPRQPSEEDRTHQAIEADKVLTGRAYARTRPDGKLEHIPASEVIVISGDVDPSRLTGDVKKLWDEFNRHTNLVGGQASRWPTVIDSADRGLLSVPVPMRLICPGRLPDGSMCARLHIDEGEFATKPHHTHSCQNCGETWRPMIGPSVGVQFLPGFKNDPK
jgi:hypothetical protein